MESNGPAILTEVQSEWWLDADAAALATIRQPTLLVAAIDSPPEFREPVEALAAALPNARKALVGGGHLIDPAAPKVPLHRGGPRAAMTTQAILLPGAVMPADLAYGALLAALGDDVQAVAKELEIYADAAPPAGYTLQHETDGVLRTADAAGFDRFHLVGYSAGGAASLVLAARHPERLLSLALIEPAWMGNDELSAEERAIWRESDRIAALPPEQMLPAFVAISSPRASSRLHHRPAHSHRGWPAARPDCERSSRRSAASSLDLDRLRAFDKPVLFALGGKSNPDYYGRMAERAHRHLPRHDARGLHGAPPLRPSAPGRARAHGDGAASALGRASD